jgi:RHS repeat-associated protein
VLEIGFTEEPDAATTDAIQLDGQSVTWTLSDDRYTLKAPAALSAGSHTLTIGTGLSDLDGHALVEGFTNTFSADSQATLALFETPDPRKTPVSTIGNPFSFHGLPKDLETGLVYMRNRYYDPELGRFITADPLRYVDGPNGYGFAVNDPVNGGDSFGLATTVQIGRYEITINAELTPEQKKWLRSQFEVRVGAALEVQEASRGMLRNPVPELLGGVWQETKRVLSDTQRMGEALRNRGWSAFFAEQRRFIKDRVRILPVFRTIDAGLQVKDQQTETAKNIQIGRAYVRGGEDLLFLLGLKESIAARGLPEEGVAPGSFNPRFEVSNVPRATGRFKLNERVVGQLDDARLGKLAGQLDETRLNQLVESPGAQRFFDANTGNINIIQEVDGQLLRITTAADKFEIISVGPIRARNVSNSVSSGRFVPIGGGGQ